ncbi:ornithine cyclodeaminase family protein [Halovenus marina]|uniref:ornithine cyclodeaminase family protein n=1 Tax=Halovenus marina TaxID=3396621 RepID=UPI003F55BC68
MVEVLFLSSQETATLAEPAAYVPAVRDGYRQRGEGAPAEPRTKLDSADPPGFLTGYFAILPDSNAMGAYTYTAGFGSRDAHFMLPLFEFESGEPLALFDGAAMNPSKTGAAGAVAVDALARADATDLAIIGSGSQARGQLLATATVRPLEQVSVYSRTPENRRAFASEMNERLDATVEAVPDAKSALDGADIVITATKASEPVFDGDDLEPGTHVTAMGQYHPERREVDATTVARSTYVPDLRARIERDAGAYILARKEGAIDDGHVHAELGDVVCGTAPGRQSAEEITLFDSGGTAIETVAAARMLYDRARENDSGTCLTLSPASDAF